MALENHVADALAKKAAEEQAGGAPVQTVTTAPVKAPTATGKSASGLEAFKATGANLRQSLTDDQKAVEGSKAGELVFVAALGNPMRKQSRVQNGADIESFEVVGYKFKSTSDITVDVADFKSDWKELTDVDFVGQRQIKAGEEFNLNLVETGLLLSNIVYGGRASGNPDKKVILSATISKDRKEPRPVLKIDTAAGLKGSVKENMILIAENQNGTGVVKPGYEKFAPLFNKVSLKKVTGATKDTGEGTANIAAAFRALYNNKLKATQQ